MQKLIFISFFIIALSCKKDQNTQSSNGSCYKCIQKVLTETQDCIKTVKGSSDNIFFPCNMTEADAREYAKDLTKFTSNTSGSASHKPCDYLRTTTDKQGTCTKL